MPGWVPGRERQPWKAASKKGGAFEDSRHARVRPSFPNHASVILALWPSEVGYKWAVPIKACHPCIDGLSGATHACHVPMYPRTQVPGTLAVFVWLAVRRVGRVSHSCQFSGPAMGTNSIDLGAPVS